MTLLHQFKVRTTGDRFTWRVLYGEDDELREMAEVCWLITLARPELARERMERNLNAGQRAPRRTWSASPRSEFDWVLRHNGREVAGVTWDGSVKRVPEWMVRIVAGLNEDRGHRDPFPEPQPPRPRHVEPVMGDFNFATGEEIPSGRGVAA